MKALLQKGVNAWWSSFLLLLTTFIRQWRLYKSLRVCNSQHIPGFIPGTFKLVVFTWCAEEWGSIPSFRLIAGVGKQFLVEFLPKGFIVHMNMIICFEATINQNYISLSLDSSHFILFWKYRIADRYRSTLVSLLVRSIIGIGCSLDRVCLSKPSFPRSMDKTVTWSLWDGKNTLHQKIRLVYAYGNLMRRCFPCWRMYVGWIV